jgi:hypothetical protein
MTGPVGPNEWTVVRLHPVWSEHALTGGEHLAMARAKETVRIVTGRVDGMHRRFETGRYPGTRGGTSP